MRAFDRRTTSSVESSTVAGLRQALAARDTGELRDLVPRFPLKIQIQTSTRCNAACQMCPYPEVTGEAGFEHQQMREEDYLAILDQLRGRPVERLSLFLMNEPLLDVRMARWLALARGALPHTRLGLFSNGSALTARRARQLAAAGLDELCVSVHGFEKHVYEAAMRGLSFDRLKDNLREVFELYRAGDLGGLHLQIVMGDLPELVSSLDHADPVLQDHVLLKAFSNEREVVEVPRGLASSRPARATAPRICQRPFVKLYVLADGRCVLCNVDWRCSVVLGRLVGPEARSVEEIWNGERYTAVRREHLAQVFETAGICARCDYARVVDDE